jgi:hypothetical protein
MEFREAIQSLAETPITRHLLLALLKDYKRPFDKIHELRRQGELVQVKRGVYVPGSKAKLAGPHPFLLANHLYGPSYVSVEAALFYWGLIPERVVEITCATTAATKTYRTPLGRFSYMHLALPYYAVGIKQVSLSKQQVALVASPEKAICDLVISTAGLLLRSVKQTKAWLLEDMRFNERELTKLNTSQMAAWLPVAPKRTSLDMLIRTLRQL